MVIQFKIKHPSSSQLIKTYSGMFAKLERAFLLLVAEKFKEEFFKEEAGFIAQSLMNKYDQLPQGPANDPTSLANTKDRFKRLVTTSLAQFPIESFILQNGKLAKELRLALVKSEDVGIGEGQLARVDSNIVYLSPYLLGTVGEYAFITEDMFRRFRKRTPKTMLGKFGAGFLLTRKSFFAEKWDSLFDFQSARHPISDFSPIDIFMETANEFIHSRLDDLIIRSARAAIKEFRKKFG